MTNLKVYLASPFFNDDELKYVKQAEDILKKRSCTVYSPRLQEVRIDEEGWDKECFRSDVRAILDADIVIALYHGNYSDSGTAWECGFAYAERKPLFIVHIGSLDHVSNLMIHQGCSANISLSDLETIDLSDIYYDFDWLSPENKDDSRFIDYCNEAYTWGGSMT